VHYTIHVIIPGSLFLRLVGFLNRLSNLLEHSVGDLSPITFKATRFQKLCEAGLIVLQALSNDANSLIVQYDDPTNSVRETQTY